jgi:mannose-1-phosphate guanylyltransferase/mannose-6-phosphate isomerase
MPARIQPVILCGGSGTRLWPTSRSSMPKQFVPLLGPHSTFQQTLLRLQGPLFARPIIVANRDHRCLVEKQAGAIDAAITLLLEPERRDSGPAILAACTLVARQDPEAVVLVLPSDHIVTEPRAFRRAVASALPAARAGRLVTFGIEADHPSTEYGWIRPGPRVEARCHAVHTFAEKPDAGRAATYLADRWLWEFRQLPDAGRHPVRRVRRLRSRHGGGGRRRGRGRRRRGRGRWPSTPRDLPAPAKRPSTSR